MIVLGNFIFEKIDVDEKMSKNDLYFFYCFDDVNNCWIHFNFFLIFIYANLRTDIIKF